MEGMSVRDEARELNGEMVSWRRHIHLHPEVGFDVGDTAAFVVERLKEARAEEVRTGVGKSGVTAMIRGARPGHTL